MAVLVKSQETTNFHYTYHAIDWAVRKLEMFVKSYELHLIWTEQQLCWVNDRVYFTSKPLSTKSVEGLIQLVNTMALITSSSKKKLIL